jgi:hypothetical protein
VEVALARREGDADKEKLKIKKVLWTFRFFGLSGEAILSNGPKKYCFQLSIYSTGEATTKAVSVGARALPNGC